MPRLTEHYPKDGRDPVGITTPEVRHALDIRGKNSNNPQSLVRVGSCDKPDCCSSAIILLARLAAALPFDVRHGYALPGRLWFEAGSAPGSGFAPVLWARGHTRGVAQFVSLNLRQGEAMPHIARQSRSELKQNWLRLYCVNVISWIVL